MSPTNNSGYTLVEVLLATVIAGIIMLGLQQILGTALSGYAAAGSKHDLLARARFAVDRIVMFVQESHTVTNPASGNAKEMIRGDERWLDTFDNTTHDYDIDGDGVKDADNDADGLVNEGPAEEDPVEDITFYLDKTDSNNWKLMETVPDYSTAALDDYRPGRLLCEHVTRFESRRVDNRIEINLALNDGASAVSLKTRIAAGRWPEAIPRESFPQHYFYIADTKNNRIRKVDAYTGIITTVTGTGKGAYSGDGGPAAIAEIKNPGGLSVDGSGNLYIADTKNHRVRKVDGATGIITTVAGSGNNGYSGDGGPATSAEINKPRGIFVDGSANIYIADTDNHRIRRVDGVTGIITTVAGTGNSGYSGDGGPAANAEFDKPGGVFVDSSDNIYIADTENHCVRMVDGSTRHIATVAGTGSGGYSGDGGAATNAQLDKPAGVSTDTAGNIYLADTENHRVRRVDASTRIISTVAGTGSGGYSGDGQEATNAQLDKPSGVAVDAAGNLYISDAENHVVRRVDSASGIIVTVTGNGNDGIAGDGWVATQAELNQPLSVYVSSK